MTRLVFHDPIDLYSQIFYSLFISHPEYRNVLNCSGLIGRSWAVLFAAAGYNVVIYDTNPQQLKSALAEILVKLNDRESSELGRGTLSPQAQHKLVVGTDSLKECVVGAKYVQVRLWQRMCTVDSFRGFKSL